MNESATTDTAPKLVVWVPDRAQIPDLTGLGCREVVLATRDTVETAGHYAGCEQWQHHVFRQNLARYTSGSLLENVLDKSLRYVAS